MKSFLVQDEWSRQPPTALPPNRANPATQDLKLLLMPGLSDDSPGLLDCTGTDVTRSLGAQGQFGSFNGSTSRIDVGTTLMVNARTTIMVGAVCDNPGGANLRYLFGGNYTPSGPELEAITLRTNNGNLEGGLYEFPGGGVIASLTAPSDGSYNTFFLLAGSGNSSDTWTVGYIPSNGVEASATSGAYAPGASRSGYRAWVGSGANNGSPWRFYAKPILWAGVWHRWLRAEERANIARQPWRLAAPYPRRVYFDFGGATNLVISDALHAHTADNLTLTQQHVLTVADASHAHLADNLTLTQTHVLAIADALHAHAVDNVVLSVEGTLAVADALHAHSADNLALTQAHALAVADALHAHAADNLTLTVGGTTLEIADALHAHAADSLALTQLHILVVSDALHAHLADTL